MNQSLACSSTSGNIAWTRQLSIDRKQESSNRILYLSRVNSLVSKYIFKLNPMAILSQTHPNSADDSWLHPSDLLQSEDHYILSDGLISRNEVAQELDPLEWKVYEFNSLAELAQIRATWNRLASQTPSATHFLTFDWLATYWKH